MKPPDRRGARLPKPPIDRKGLEKLRERALARCPDLKVQGSHVPAPEPLEERRAFLERALAEFVPRAIKGDREARLDLRWVIVDCLRDTGRPLPELARLYLLWALGDLGGPELQALRDLVDTGVRGSAGLHLETIDEAFGEKRDRGRDAHEEDVKRRRSAEIVTFLAFEQRDQKKAYAAAAKLLGYTSTRSLRNFCGGAVATDRADRESSAEHILDLCRGALGAVEYFLRP